MNEVQPRSEYAAAIEAHYARTWAAPSRRLRFAEGPVHELPSEFAVLAIPVSEHTMAYATRCMSSPDDDERLELHVLTYSSPEPDVDLIELMTVVAHFHRTGARLGLGHSVDIGRPWLPGSTCTHGVISLPYLFCPKLERLNVSVQRTAFVTRADDSRTDRVDGKGIA
jgi:hypothetical protein